MIEEYSENGVYAKDKNEDKGRQYYDKEKIS